MEKVNFKDISEFDLKEVLDGTEEIQVSSTEKINLKDQLDKTKDLYVADFTIEDLESLSETNTRLNINARALISALDAGKAIGIRQGNGNNESMSIASAFRETDDPIIHLTVISGDGIMYKVSIDAAFGENNPDVADSESGRIHYSWLQVIPVSDVYIVTEFTARDIVALTQYKNPTLTISRNFLDAMYKGMPIWVKVYPGTSSIIPISVDSIDNPNNSTRFQFRVKQGSIEYEVFTRNVEVTTGKKTLSVGLNTYNSADWNESAENNIGYIANRTHYPHRLGSFIPGDRYSIQDTETIHDLNNYRLLVRGDLFKIQEGDFSIENQYIHIDLRCVRSESGSVVTWTLTSFNPSGFENNEVITVVSKLGDYKPLDEFYLPDTVGRVYRTEFTVNEMLNSQKITISREFVEAILEEKIIVIPHDHAAGSSGDYIANSHVFRKGDGITGSLQVTFNNNILLADIRLMDSEVSKTINVVVTELQEDLKSGNNIKTINGTSILGSGNITALTGIKTYYGNLTNINEGVLQPEPGDFAGFSTKAGVVSSVTDSQIILWAYTRTTIPSTIKNDITISLDGAKKFPNAEWEFLFEVDSDTNISISMNTSWIGNSVVIRCKENGITLDSLSRGYYRLKAIIDYNLKTCLVEIDKFNS